MLLFVIIITLTLKVLLQSLWGFSPCLGQKLQVLFLGWPTLFGGRLLVGNCSPALLMSLNNATMFWSFALLASYDPKVQLPNKYWTSPVMAVINKCFFSSFTHFLFIGKKKKNNVWSEFLFIYFWVILTNIFKSVQGKIFIFYSYL